MRKTRLLSLSVISCVLLAVVIHCSQAQDDGFVSLFDGKTMKGWRMNEGQEGHWRAVNGILAYDGKSEAPKRQDKDLYTEKWFHNFIFMFEWRWPNPPHEGMHRITLPDGGFATNPDGSWKREKRMSAGDSGIYLRGWSKLQMNLWDHPMGSGQLYGFMHDFSLPVETRRACAPSKKNDKPPMEWNMMKITMIDNAITIEQNGEVIVDVELPNLPYGGPLAIQHHGDEIEFRNLRIKEL